MNDSLPSFSQALGIEELQRGAPTVLALARLCGLAWLQRAEEPVDLATLRPEARAILYTARERGILELKANDKAFEAAQRMLTVYVEVDGEEWARFRKGNDVRVAIRFLEAFRQLCQEGLLVHQLQQEFTLTERGFQAAAEVEPAELEEPLAAAERCGFN